MDGTRHILLLPGTSSLHALSQAFIQDVQQQPQGLSHALPVADCHAESCLVKDLKSADNVQQWQLEA